MANRIYVVEDDTDYPVRLNIQIPAFCLNGDVYWCDGLNDLEGLINEKGTPDFLILDNNLGYDRGIDYVLDRSESGILDTRQTTIAAISSSDTSLIFRMVKALNEKGIGAFPKFHTAEACAWMAVQAKRRKEGNNNVLSQDEVYAEGGMRNSDAMFFASFGMQVDKAIRQVGLLPHLAAENAHKYPWEYQSGSLIVPEAETAGVFQRLVKEDRTIDEIRGLQIDELVGHYERIRGEGTPPGQRR